MSDLLERATRALRDQPEVAPPDLASGRARLLAATRRPGGARLSTIRWVLPLAAVLAFGTAFAAATGRLAWLTGGSRREALPPPAVAASASPSGPWIASSPVSPASAEPVPSAPPSVTASASSAPSTLPSPAGTPSADAIGADLAAYRRAHTLHFSEKRWDAALDAWAAYLAAFPAGTFALEARYNRAICLVKLGRRAEARAALTPFAEGKVAGGYRRTEARALLDALPD